MGAPMAPMYANVFMYTYEKRHILTQYGEHYFRFINDILLLWIGSTEEFNLMMQNLNSLPSPVRFIFETSTTHINFLDLQIFVTGKQFRDTLCSKPTDSNTILHASSFHPTNLKDSLPIFQFIRVLRNNSDHYIAETQIKDMFTKFLTRGYSKTCLNLAYTRAVKSITENKIHQANGERFIFPQAFHSES
ncbi:Hypothetical predicted protein [Pelobates cultripes]|uniref:Helix-turn-helix domain-containing protein n=1 Tax=Pelobates cultripes TaxID=61616 RepID=A0AAD1VR15_PELCU|nr:Hypothetical predicted protein [Pelobates cultripes]